MDEPKKENPFDHGWLYPPRKGATYLGKVKTSNAREILGFDQQKLNLVWLLSPEMDEGGLDAVPDAVANAINDKMATDLRDELRKMPKAFLAWLSKQGCADFEIFEHSPPDFYDTIVRRANEAQARLLGVVEEGNITKANFNRLPEYVEADKESTAHISEFKARHSIISPEVIARKDADLVNFELSKAGMGFGVVTYTPSNLDSSTDLGNSINLVTACMIGTSVRLSATAEAGSVFLGWSGDIVATDETITVQINGPKSITANFLLAAISEQADIAESEFKLGKKYFEGDGVERDFKKSAECYLKAAKLGSAKAQNNLGLLYWSGIQVQKNENEAAAWILKAAEQGLDIAQCNIASHFLEKDGPLPYDPEQAVMWYSKAAEQGNSDAQCCLGAIYEEGVVVPQDEQQAKSFYLKAALQDDEEAQSWLWRRARLESAEQPERVEESPAPISAVQAGFGLAPDHAVALVRAATDLLKKNPKAFLPELAELRRLILENNVAAPSHAASIEAPPLPDDTPSLAKVAKWLLGKESVTLIALRTYLLPLDLLPSAVIDELNELALDSIDEPALEEIGDEILVMQDVLAKVLLLQNEAAGPTGQKE